MHHGKARQHAGRQHEHRHQGAAGVEQEDDADQGDDEDLLSEGLAECLDRSVDQVAAVVADLDGHAGRKAFFQFGKLFARSFNRGSGVLAEAHDDDAPDDLTLTIPFRNAPSDVRPDADVGDVGQVDRRAIRRGSESDLGELIKHPCGAEILDRSAGGTGLRDLLVGEGSQVADAADHELGLAHLDEASADVEVGPRDGSLDRAQRHVVRQKPDRVDDHLVLLDEPADRGDLADALDRDELIPQIPVLEAAQVREVQRAGLKRRAVEWAAVVASDKLDGFQPRAHLGGRGVGGVITAIL